MRRVQAQRLALEEQNANNYPVKATPGIAVSAPPSAAPKKAAKTTAPVPVKIPQVVPIAVPIIETPKVEPKPIVKEPVIEPIPAEVEAPKLEPVLVEQSRAEIENEAHVEVEAPAPITAEAPVIETPPVEPPTVEAAADQETEFILPAGEPVIEAIPPVEAPVVAPTETEIQILDTVVIKTEMKLMHDVCEPEPEVEAETLAEEEAVTEVEVEVTTTEEISVPKPATATAEQPVGELTIDQVSAEAEPAADSVVRETVIESVIEATTERPEPEQVIKEVSPAAPTEEGEDEGEVEVLDEEDAAAVPAEPVTAAEVSDTIPDALVTKAEAPVVEEKVAVADILVDVTESVSAVQVNISASAAVEQEIVTTMETFSTQMESMDVTPDPALAAVPAKDVIIDAAEQSGLEMLSEEPKPEICDMPCQMQIPGEPVQLSSAEISMETALNGHIVPEVSIEG